jgi:hypothetical protein
MSPRDTGDLTMARWLEGAGQVMVGLIRQAVKHNDPASDKARALAARSGRGQGSGIEGVCQDPGEAVVAGPGSGPRLWVGRIRSH